MANLTVIVPLLNKRSLPVDDTSDKGNVTGKVKAGFQFEPVEQLTNAAGNWFRDKDGGWYWGGGLSDGAANTPVPGLNLVPVENDLSKKLILNNPVSSNGKGITIGVLDTGIDTRHPSLNNSCIGSRDYLTEPHEHEIKNDHGTKVAGILVGNDDRIKGLVIDAKIESYRTNDNDGNTDDDAVIKALTDISNSDNPPDILNLSLDIAFNYISDMQKCVNILTARGVIVVVAGFSAELLGGVSNIAKVKGTIPVGIIETDDFTNIKESGINKAYKCTFVNSEITTMGIFDSPDPHPSFASSSAFTAITTGIIAKFLSSNTIPMIKRNDEVKAYLESISFNIKTETVFTQLKPYRNDQA